MPPWPRTSRVSEDALQRIKRVPEVQRAHGGQGLLAHARVGVRQAAHHQHERALEVQLAHGAQDGRAHCWVFVLHHGLERRETRVDAHAAQALGQRDERSRGGAVHLAQLTEPAKQRVAPDVVRRLRVLEHLAHGLHRVAGLLPLDDVQAPDLGVGGVHAQVVGEAHRVQRLVGHPAQPLGQARVAGAPLLGQRQRGQALVHPAHARVEAEVVVAVDGRRERVLRHLGHAAVLEQLGGRLLLRLRATLAVVRLVGQAVAPAELRGLAQQGGRGVQLTALHGQLGKVFEVLEHVVLEVVGREDADAAQVALGQVLERALLSDVEQHLVAVERALALPDGLEPVGGRLDGLHAQHALAARGGVVFQLLTSAAQVEAHEAQDVEVLAQPGVLREPLPQQARRAQVAGVLLLDGGVAQPAGFFEGTRGLRRGLGHDVQPRAVERRVFRQALGTGQVSPEHPQRGHRASAPERRVRAVGQREAGAQLLVGHVAAAQQRPQRHQRSLRVARVQLLGGPAVRLARVHQRRPPARGLVIRLVVLGPPPLPCGPPGAPGTRLSRAASSTMSSARLARWSLRRRACSSTTCTVCRRCR
jgi:hypothetical protein